MPELVSQGWQHDRGPARQSPEIVQNDIEQGAGDYARRQAIRYAHEVAKRKIEPLKLYQPTPLQEKYHACTAMECILQGGNQFGKSLAGFVETVRAVLGQDPHNKYPKRDGVAAVVGYKESHVALNIYRYLLKAGAFKIIRDAETGLWRTWHPWIEADKAREKEAKPAPPLIPKRMIKDIHYKSKVGNIIKRIDLVTGWELHVFSSTAKPDQGFQADLVHIDEDIENEDWYSEMVARLSLREGKLRWTALPHNQNDALSRLAERGEEEAAIHARGGPEPSTVVIRATIHDNPYMTDKVKMENIKRWKAVGDDEYRKRALGELVTDTVRMYPTWSKDLHAVQRYRESHPEIFGEYFRTGEPPDNWCLRSSVDPGHGTCGALFIATSPPLDELEGESIHLFFNELYIHQCNASKFGESFEKVVRKRWYQSWILDAHGGNLTSLDTGLSPRQVYEKQLLDRGCLSIETKHRFKSGCDQIQYRETLMRERLSVQPHGLPQFLFDEERCPNLHIEMHRFRKQKVKGEVIDKGNRRVKTHLVECAEYLAAEPLTYTKPPPRRRVETPGEARARNYFERKKRRRSSGLFGVTHGASIHLGPHGALQ